MGVTINGNNITITNATIDVINGANPESGVAYIVITPEGGVGELPFMSTGQPGQPTLFPSITVVQHPAGEALPNPNPVKTLLDPGGPGLPAKYALEFHVNAGADGPPGSPSISGASDLAASPVLGVATDKFVLVYRASDSKFVPTAQKVGTVHTPATSISATAFDNTALRLLTSINVPAQPWDWFPLAYAKTVVTGSDGATPTRVDLFARVDDAANGDIVGHARGLIGSNGLGLETVMIPSPPPDQVLPGSYGVVPAGVNATIHIRAEQVAASSSSWSTPASPDTNAFVVVHPLP